MALLVRALLVAIVVATACSVCHGLCLFPSLSAFSGTGGTGGHLSRSGRTVTRVGIYNDTVTNRFKFLATALNLKGGFTREPGSQPQSQSPSAASMATDSSNGNGGGRGAAGEFRILIHGSKNAFTALIIPALQFVSVFSANLGVGSFC